MPIYPATKTFGFNQLTGISSAVGLANGLSAIAALAVNAGGTGYNVGDRISPAAGTGLQAVFFVTAVSNGVVTAVSLTFFANEVQPGLYSGTPGSTGVATSAVSGSGSGLTVNLTYTTNTIPVAA